MSYIRNPKLRGSGILACIPQSGICPVGCDDCFFQSGRSYLEPLDSNLPNMPSVDEAKNMIVRVNDGNDSNHKREDVIEAMKPYPMKFYNTSMPKHLEDFDAPVVLTVNPGKKTDKSAALLESIPENLMFVRIRVNTWNLDLVDEVVEHYAKADIPIVLTFMAYYKGDIPEGHKDNYVYRTRTMNSYYAITTDAWESIMSRYKYNKWVYSCGKIEGEKGITSCRHCGNCLREYFASIQRMEG